MAQIPVTMDGQLVLAQAGETLLEVARRIGIRIPTLCHVAQLTPLDTCLVCVVQVAGQDALVPSCATPVAAGMEVRTDSQRVLSARRGAIELLLSEHTGECLAPCQIACPAGLDIPEFLQTLPTDAPAAALLALRGLALPSTLGWICNAPCERACRREELDQPIEIRRLHRLVTADGQPMPGAEPPTFAVGPPTGEHVAVVGSGPAGLAAALRLLLHGHECTLFELQNQLGGMLRGLDAETLPVPVLEADLAVLRDLGVRQRLGVGVGADLPLPALLTQFDAVVLATGAAADAPTSEDPKVFRAGAAAGHAGLAVRVVADGLAVADRVDRLLMAKPAPPERIRVRYGELDDDGRAFVHRGQHAQAPQPMAAASRQAEAMRCLACGCEGHDTCSLRTIGGEVGATPRRFGGAHRPLLRDDSHPDLVYESHKCILCQACVRLCEPTAEHAGLTVAGRGFDSRVTAPYDQPLAQALDAETARRLADACPTSAMRRKR